MRTRALRNSLHYGDLAGPKALCKAHRESPGKKLIRTPKRSSAPPRRSMAADNTQLVIGLGGYRARDVTASTTLAFGKLIAGDCFSFLPRQTERENEWERVRGGGGEGGRVSERREGGSGEERKKRRNAERDGDGRARNGKCRRGGGSSYGVAELDSRRAAGEKLINGSPALSLCPFQKGGRERGSKGRGRVRQNDGTGGRDKVRGVGIKTTGERERERGREGERERGSEELKARALILLMHISGAPSCTETALPSPW